MSLHMTLTINFKTKINTNTNQRIISASSEHYQCIISTSSDKDKDNMGSIRVLHCLLCLFSYFSLHGQFSTLPLSALLLLCFTQLPRFRHSLQPSQNSLRHIILSPIVFLFIENFETGPRLFLIYLAFSLSSGSQSSVASKTHPLS